MFLFLICLAYSFARIVGDTGENTLNKWAFLSLIPVVLWLATSATWAYYMTRESRWLRHWSKVSKMRPYVGFEKKEFVKETFVGQALIYICLTYLIGFVMDDDFKPAKLLRDGLDFIGAIS